MTNTFHNCSKIAKPLGLHSHSAVVPEGSELIFVSGQVGIRPDGSLPRYLYHQADQAFSNVMAILADHNLTYRDIVKLTTFIVGEDANGDVRKARLEHLRDHRPTSTAVWVTRLVDSTWLVEIEAIAAKRPTAGRATER